MSSMSISFRDHVLAWSVSEADERRFKRILQAVLGVSLLLILLFKLMPTPQVDRSKPAELPPRIAKLLLEKKPLPPPPPPVKPELTPEQKAAAEAKPEAAKPEAKPEPPKPQTTKPEPNKAPVPEARVPKPDRAPGEEVVAAARRKAAGVGLLAMKDELAELRGAPVAVQLKPDIKQGPGVGAGVGVGVGAGREAGLPERALITSNATNGSGGINTAALSRDTGGGGLAGRATTLVEGVAGGGGGGGAGGGGGRGGTGKGGGGADAGGANKGGNVQRGNSGKAGRALEDIRLVFERNKGSIYAIYNRALREDPSLQGKVVLELKIAPGGNVVDCRIVSSELKAPELEQKLLARVRQFDFGAKDVDLMVVSYPVDFLPS